MCKKKETYVGKTVGDKIVRFKSKMNQHVNSTCMSISVVWKASA